MEVPSLDFRSRNTAICLASLVLLLSCFRLAHVHLLWADEDYHLAAAIDILHGKIPYRDFWYDKPPLSAVYYLLIGGWYGWPLRLLDAAYICASCWVAYRLSSVLWSRAEGFAAAILLAFFTTFYLPSAVIPFAADAVMLLPHLLAIYFAMNGRAAAAGCLSGLAFLANTKAVFVFASCCLFLFPEVLWLSVAFLLTCLAGLGALAAVGAWPGYVEQVWKWGLIYAKESPVTRPFWNGVGRTLNWMGFHLAVVAGAVFFFVQSRDRIRWKLGGWIVLSFFAVALGGRFAPHYFLQLLPAVVISASRGLTLGYIRYRRFTIAIVVALLAIPLVRFGPRYLGLAINYQGSHWSDTAMDLDSAAVAAQIKASSKPGDTLFVWGYRPDVYVFSRLVSDSRFWDSQPLTGVPADRHLSASVPIFGGLAQSNRRELVRSRPTWLVDGLGLLNPKLRLETYPDLRPWLEHYRLMAKTPLSLIYRRRD